MATDTTAPESSYQTYQVRNFDEEGGGEDWLPAPSRETTFDPSPLARSTEDEPGEGFEQAGAGEAVEETDFASIRFQRENTLLTNAEQYAGSIREEAELYVSQLRSEVQALNQQAEARYEEAREIKEDAERQAKAMISDAEGRVNEIREQARGEGFEAGRLEGMEKRYQEAAPLVRNIEKVLAEVAQFRRQVRFYMEKDGIRLAVLMAKKILHRELKLNSKVIWKILAATLAKMEGQGTFRISLHPEDHKFATAARPSLEKYLKEGQRVAFRPNPELAPGTALIETDREVIDLTLETQFYHLEKELYGALGRREALLTRKAPPKPVQATPPKPAPAQPTPEQPEPGPEETARAAENAEEQPSRETAEARSEQQTPPTEAEPEAAAGDGQGRPEPEAAPARPVPSPLPPLT